MLLLLLLLRPWSAITRAYLVLVTQISTAANACTGEQPHDLSHVRRLYDHLQHQRLISPYWPVVNT